MKLTGNHGMLLLGAWLIAYGLVDLMRISFDGLGVIMSALAIAAGVMILGGK